MVFRTITVDNSLPLNYHNWKWVLKLEFQYQKLTDMGNKSRTSSFNNPRPPLLLIVFMNLSICLVEYYGLSLWCCVGWVVVVGYCGWDNKCWAVATEGEMILLIKTPLLLLVLQQCTKYRGMWWINEFIWEDLTRTGGVLIVIEDFQGEWLHLI